MGNFHFLAAGKLTFGGGVQLQSWLASDHPGAYTSMPHPFFGAKDVCYILKKRWPNKKLFLARRACSLKFYYYRSCVVALLLTPVRGTSNYGPEPHWGTARKKMYPQQVYGLCKSRLTLYHTHTLQYFLLNIYNMITSDHYSVGHYPNTALFNNPKKNSLAGEWPKLFRENNVEKTRLVWCTQGIPPKGGKFSQRAAQ